MGSSLHSQALVRDPSDPHLKAIPQYEQDTTHNSYDYKKQEQQESLSTQHIKDNQQHCMSLVWGQLLIV